MCAWSVTRSSSALAQADVREHLGPLREGQVGGDHERRPFASFRNHLEQKLGADIGEWDVAELVDVCWFSVKMTARLDVNATPGVRMSPLAPGIVPECSGASRVKRAARAGFAALDSPCALWYSLVVGERERSGAPGIRVFMRAPCYYAAHAAPLVPAPVSGPAPTRSLGPCQP